MRSRGPGIVFAHYDRRLLLFGAVTATVLIILARYAPWMFRRLGSRVSEPQTKFVALILLGLGRLASIAGSEAVLPTYLVGMSLAPTFLSEPELPHRMRIILYHEFDRSRRNVHDVAHVHGAYLRLDLRPLRTDEQHYRPGPIRGGSGRRRGTLTRPD